MVLLVLLIAAEVDEFNLRVGEYNCCVHTEDRTRGDRTKPLHRRSCSLFIWSTCRRKAAFPVYLK